MQVALHAPIAGMAGLALGLDFSKKLLQYATTALWHTAKVPLLFFFDSRMHFFIDFILISIEKLYR